MMKRCVAEIGVTDLQKAFTLADECLERDLSVIRISDRKSVV